MATILVQISEHDWTRQAVHLACALARSTDAEVALLYLAQVNSPALLGTELEPAPRSLRELAAIDDYIAIGNRYDREVSLKCMQCVSTTDALLQAVEHTKAAALFARIPNRKITIWRRFQMWWMQQQCAQRGCVLYTVDAQPVDGWKPSVTVKAMR